MENSSQKTTINVLYITLVISTILSFVPNGMAQGLSLVLVSAVLLCAYATRAKDSTDGLLHNHMTYLIGTVWIGTGFILLGALVTGLWVYTQGDNSVIDSTIARLEGGWVPTEGDIKTILADYKTANGALLLQARIVATGPAVLYFMYRVVSGYGRAIKGYRIAKPNSWL